MRELSLFAGAGGGILGGIYWDGEQFVPSNMPSFLGKYCLLDNEMVSCHDFPYGTTSEHLMEIFGVVALMSSVVASPAKTSVQPVKGLGLQGKDLAYGPKWRGLLVKLGPNGYWLKTHHSSHPEDLTPFCETWPRWGYDAEWGVLGAVDAGAPHKRERIWIVANTTKL